MMRELKPLKFAAGSARMISMVVLVVILVCAYVALDFYTSGQQNASMAEGRGGAIVDALSRYKRETGGLPDTLEKLAPKLMPTLPKCPNGQAYAYKPAAADYTLTCQEVLFKSKPYQYDSKSRAWSG
jgi:type II secretory pathway pseudopilin PulG